MLQTKKITTLGLFLALGLLLPYVTSHMFGVPGTILLPMHIPVILIGFLFGPLYGLLLGILIPLLSSFLTGMPGALFLPIMVVELALYGLVSGFTYKKLKWNTYFSLLSAMIVGRIGYFLTILVLTNLFGLVQFAKVASVFTAITVGLPGIIVQIILLPLLVRYLGKYIHD